VKYFREFAKFVVHAFSVSPLGFCLINTGGTTATGIRVHLEISNAEKILVLPEAAYPIRPLHKYKLQRGFEPLASYCRPSQKDIVVKMEGSETVIEWNVAKALPHLPVFSEGVFFVGRCGSALEFYSTIYGENIKRPVQSRMTVLVDTISKNLTVEEIRELSDAFVRSDTETGIGRIPILHKA